jgi:hypothetical protein
MAIGLLTPAGGIDADRRFVLAGIGTRRLDSSAA